MFAFSYHHSLIESNLVWTVSVFAPSASVSLANGLSRMVRRGPNQCPDEFDSSIYLLI